MESKKTKQGALPLPCELIQDLLPAYIDRETGQETNVLIRKHLTSCRDCSGIYSVMKLDPEQVALRAGMKRPDYIGYMKQIRESRRTIRRVILLLLLLLPLAVLGAIRSSNDYLNQSDFVRTGMIASWEDGKLVLDEPYIALDAEIDCEKFFPAGCYMTDVYEEGKAEPEYEIRDQQGFLAWLTNSEGRYNIYRHRSDSGCPIYSYGEFGLLYCREKDVKAIREFYSDPSNIEIGFRVYPDNAEYLDVAASEFWELRLTDEERSELYQLRADQADTTLTDDLPSLELQFQTKDHLLFAGADLYELEGSWYWDMYYTDDPMQENGAYTLKAVRLPDSISRKITKLARENGLPEGSAYER